MISTSSYCNNDLKTVYTIINDAQVIAKNFEVHYTHFNVIKSRYLCPLLLKTTANVFPVGVSNALDFVSLNLMQVCS